MVNYSVLSNSIRLLSIIAAAEAASSIIGCVPFKPGIFAISDGLRIVPFSVIDGRWLKWMKLVSLAVMLTMVPVNGSVLNMSDAFWMVPKSIGAIPTCKAYWLEFGLNPRKVWNFFLLVHSVHYLLKFDQSHSFAQAKEFHPNQSDFRWILHQKTSDQRVHGCQFKNRLTMRFEIEINIGKRHISHRNNLRHIFIG